MREDHELVRRITLDEQEAGMLREALVQYMVDVASMVESSTLPDAPAGETRARLRRLAGIAGALDAIGWDAGAGQIEPLQHRAVVLEALHAQITDLEGRDTPSETEIALCQRLLAMMEDTNDERR